MVCVKADINSNAYYLMKYPKLIDVYIRVFERLGYDFRINGLNMDLSCNKPLYVLYYFNHSFMPFSKKQRRCADMILECYNKYKEG